MGLLELQTLLKSIFKHRKRVKNDLRKGTALGNISLEAMATIVVDKSVTALKEYEFILDPVIGKRYCIVCECLVPETHLPHCEYLRLEMPK